MKKLPKAVYRTANLLLPVWETSLIVKSARYAAGKHAERLGRLMPTKADMSAPVLSFDEAVSVSGHSREALMRRYQLGKRIWLSMFVLTVSIMLIMLLASIVSDIHATGMLIIRMASMMFMLAAFAGLVFTCALKSQYRFWQLQSSHLGTFAEWRSSRRWVVEILSWR